MQLINTVTKSYFTSMLKYHFLKLVYQILGDELTVKIKYRLVFKRKLDFNHLDTLNSKLNYLKIHYDEELYTTVADKYAARKWLSDRFGEEYLVPLFYYTDDYRDIKPENIPNEPCVIKNNNGSGTVHIVRNKSIIDWKQLQTDCKIWLSQNFYYKAQEKQYKNMKPHIIVEKMLETSDGKIPNDYKLTFFNGILQFVYCSVDREGKNYRVMYTPDWEPIDFSWVSWGHRSEDAKGPDIAPPESYELMRKFGSEIAKEFKYVRIDFYDVDGRLYFGEITLSHGGGMNRFVPDCYDFYWGEKLKLD